MDHFCKTCKWFSESIDDGEPLGMGDCKRYPPSPQAMYAVPSPSAGSSPVIHGASDWLKWPNVYEDDYCGEWSFLPQRVI